MRSLKKYIKMLIINVVFKFFLFFIFHVFLMFHILLSFLSFYIFVILRLGSSMVFSAGVFFAVHPLHTEPVNSIGKKHWLKVYYFENIAERWGGGFYVSQVVKLRKLFRYIYFNFLINDTLHYCVVGRSDLLYSLFFLSSSLLSFKLNPTRKDYKMVFWMEMLGVVILY